MSKKNRGRKTNVTNNNLVLDKINPITPAQLKTFQSYYNNKNLFLSGYAGTGKTFIAVGLALEDLMNTSYYTHLKIIRSAVSSRDIGHLPGSILEKTKIFEQPYTDIVNELFGRGDAYDILKIKKKIDFTTTSFLRGTTFKDSIILVDECQNMTFQELDTIITRFGDNCKIIFAGDYRQTDLNKKTDFSGIHSFTNIIKSIGSFEFIDFKENDIVRSGLVKEYIIAKENINNKNIQHIINPVHA